LDAVRSATEKSYSLPVLIGDHSIVDAESAAPHLLFRNSREDIVQNCGREEFYSGAGRDGRAVVAVAGEGKRRVGQSKNEPAVAACVPIQHILANRHSHSSKPRTDFLQQDAEALRCRIVRIHNLGRTLSSIRIVPAYRRARGFGGRLTIHRNLPPENILRRSSGRQPPLERPPRRIRPNVEEQHRMTRRGSDLSDAGTHGARSDDTDLLISPQRRHFTALENWARASP